MGSAIALPITTGQGALPKKYERRQEACPLHNGSYIGANQVMGELSSDLAPKLHLLTTAVKGGPPYAWLLLYGTARDKLSCQ